MDGCGSVGCRVRDAGERARYPLGESGNSGGQVVVASERSVESRGANVECAGGRQERALQRSDCVVRFGILYCDAFLLEDCIITPEYHCALAREQRREQVGAGRAEGWAPFDGQEEKLPSGGETAGAIGESGRLGLAARKASTVPARWTVRMKRRHRTAPMCASALAGTRSRPGAGGNVALASEPKLERQLTDLRRHVHSWSAAGQSVYTDRQSTSVTSWSHGRISRDCWRDGDGRRQLLRGDWCRRAPVRPARGSRSR